MTALATAGLVSTSSPAFAVHALQMQLDGNTAVDPLPQPVDWETMFGKNTSPKTGETLNDVTEKGGLPTGFVARGHSVDYPLPDVSTYATGSKDTLNIGAISSSKTAAGWQCSQSNNLLAKDDLVNVYTAAYRNPANQHLILYFGAEKSSNGGDNNIGIWFVQDASVGCSAPLAHKNYDWTGHHQPGDVLLTAAFTNGGTTAAVESHAWTSSADNGGEGKLGAANAGFLCTPPTGAENPATDTSACAITNLSEFDPPWNHPVKVAGANGTALAAQEFYEGGVDVTQLEKDSGNTDTDPCIATFVADTRTSQSTTATIMDYAAGSLPVCHPATQLSVSANPTMIHSGDSVTWTATEQNVGTSPLDQVAVTDSATTGACTPFAPTLKTDGVHNIGDANNNGILDPGPNMVGETWTFTCTQALTDSRTIHLFGSGRDTFSHKIVAGGPSTACQFDDTKNPPTVTFQADNYVCDPNERASASVTVIHPSTTLKGITATVSPTIAHFGDTVTYTFYETNNGDVNLTNPSVSTDDAHCASLTTPVSGDTSDAGVLDVGETWKFVCTTSYTSSSTGGVADPAGGTDFTIHAIGHGFDPLGADVTFYSGCTTGTVANGKLCNPDEATSQSVRIINPGTTLRELIAASLTFTYNETNSGDSPISSPTVSSSDCAGTSADQVIASGHNVGDSNGNGVFDPGETWKFTCTKSLTITSGNTATTTDTGTGHGTDAAGGTVPTTNETDSSTGTITNNPPN